VRHIPPLLALACSGGIDKTDSTSASEGPRPNIIVVTLDTLRADALGAYGNKAKPSPNIDALAASGYRFTRAYTVTPLTIPAHSSLWTSLLPPRHGVQDNGDFFLDEGAVTLAEKFQAAGYQTMASVGAEVTSHHWGFAQGFDSYFDDMGSSREKEKNRWRVERPGTEVVSDAMGWFQNDRSPAKPFFAWIHMFDIHHPYEPVEPHKSKFPDRPYLGEVATADAILQSFIDKLTALGETENTWIFVLSDHGEGRGSHGEMLHGALLYNATTRIPFIVVPPSGDGGGTRIDFPTSIVDVFPTALSLASIEVPSGLDGIDLSPWLKPGKASAPPLQGRNVYVESLYAYRHYGWAPQKAWVTDNHKLIDSTTPEIYDAWDIPEKKNLAEASLETISELKTELSAFTSAMVTDESTSGRAELSEERLEQLASLGYITTTVDQDQPTENLPNPVDRLPMLREVERARQLLQGGLIDEAKVQIAKVLAEEPTFVDMRALQAQLLIRTGDIDAAYKAALALDKDHPSTNHKSLIASTQLRLGQPAAAAATFESIIDIDPYLKDSWNGWLTSLFLAGQIPKLDQAVIRAKAYFPNEAVVQTFEGIVLVMKNQTDAAEVLLLNVLNRNPGQPFVNHSLGLMKRAKGEADKAEQFLTEEIRMHPPAIPARRTMVELLAEQRRYEDQITQLDAIKAAERPGPLTLHSRAQALFNLGRYDECAVDLAECEKLDGKYAGCWMLLANLLSKQGKPTEAKAAHVRALKLAKLPPVKRSVRP
jgi:arylsulfatase A-like enzyme/tetratricopeptide (TPR) repeat protein